MTYAAATSNNRLSLHFGRRAVMYSGIFGDDIMGVTQIKERFNQLKNELTLLENDQCSERPQAVRNATVIE
ncbi:hypothetical protein TNCV_5083411 [Trichonephila clavipes]|nr:hypothetical protein TNCV_5083411 [Trichonephila clavipes]